MTARFLDNVSTDDYYADRLTDRPALSQSVASVLVRQSAYHAYLAHPPFGGVRREGTPATDRGTLIHALVLGSGMDKIEIIDAPNFRTKAAQEKRDAAIANGRTPILAHEIRDAEAVARDIRDAIAEAGFALDGRSEAVAVWEEETEHGPIQCRGMIDHVPAGDAIILDLKTCRSAHPKACASHVLDYGYGIQHAAYTSALEKINPAAAGRIDFVWIFAEEQPPSAGRRAVVTVARPDGSLRELGQRQWRRACEGFARGLKFNDWPAYGAVTLAAPPWAVADEDAA